MYSNDFDVEIYAAESVEVENIASQVLDENEIRALNSEKEHWEQIVRSEKFKVKLLEENIEKVRTERETVRQDYVRIKKELEYVSKADRNAVTALSAHRQSLKRRTGLLEMFKELGAESELDAKLAKGMEEAEQQSSSFSALIAHSPWIVEKNRLKRELEESETRLTQIYEDIGEKSKRIALFEDLVRGHRDVPFRKVCIALAEYADKSRQLQRLYERERDINKEWREKNNQMQGEFSFLNSTIRSELEDAAAHHNQPAVPEAHAGQVDCVPVLGNRVRFNMALQMKSASATFDTTAASTMMGDCMEEDDGRILDRLLNEPLVMNMSGDDNEDEPN